VNSFGRLFRVSIYGESHGSQVGVLIDGCPSGIPISEEDFISDLGRRKAGAKGTTPRIEDDMPIIATGVFEGKTTGAPINIYFENKNTASKDYSEFRDNPRPGHADFTAMHKYKGANDYRGGGHFSGRLTLGIVAAGVIAKKILSPANIDAKLIEAGGNKDIDTAIDRAIKAEDSIGGIVECRITGIPIGLGEPFFDSVESYMSHIMFAIPAIKGIEFGLGFESARITGSQNNDPIIDPDGTTATNNAGGINGGISNGNEIVFRVAVKPTSSIKAEQQTINLKSGEVESLKIKGRHDVCLALRFPPIIEAAAAIALSDLWLMDLSFKRVQYE
jgi:chorismate synthase